VTAARHLDDALSDRTCQVYSQAPGNMPATPNYLNRCG
jgi:hypothetical protein